MKSDTLERTIIDVIIPARNEEKAIGRVIGDLPSDMIRSVIVADNGSTDRTAEVAMQHGAIIATSNVPGYGHACLSGIELIHSMYHQEYPDVIVFIDGDYSDFPEQLPDIVAPIVEAQYDLVIGSRVLGTREAGALTPQQRVGNALATTLIRWIYGYRFTDLGPFRAIRWDALQSLGMTDKTYGWTVEMQVKAARSGMRCTEYPVSYRRRIGKSKVSGTVKGSVLAGYKIMSTIVKLI